MGLVLVDSMPFCATRRLDYGSGRIFFLEKIDYNYCLIEGLILGSGLLLGFFAVLMRVSKRPVVHSNPFFFAGLVLVGCHNLIDFNTSLFTAQLTLLIGYLVIHHRHAQGNDFFKVPMTVPLTVLCLSAFILLAGFLRFGANGISPRFAAFRGGIRDCYRTVRYSSDALGV